MASPLNVVLATLGDPEQLSGGYLYHRRLADLAPAHDARLGFVSVPPGPFPLPGLAARRLLHAILDAQPDAVLLDSIVAAYLMPVVRELARRPLLGSIHQPPGGMDHGPLRSRLQARLDLLAYRQVPLLIAASAHLAEQLVRAGVPRRKLQVVPPGRDVVPDAVHGDVPTLDLRQGRAAALLCVANWLPRKGILLLLDAVARLPADAATLHLVGDPDVDALYAERVRTRLAAPDLQGRVLVHGPRTLAEVAAFYTSADIFVLASTQEPFGTVYGEAMALGLPVVGLASGNLRHLATDGVDGRIVPVGNAARLAEALAELIRDEPLRRRMGEAARERATFRPTWDEVATRYFTLVRRMVDHHRH